MIIDFIFDILHINRCREYVTRPFVCPNCGHEFYTRWYRLWFLREWTMVACKKAKLKCPSCGEKDMCRWTGEWDP